MRSRAKSCRLPLPGPFTVLAVLVLTLPARGAWIWVEGEKPVKSTMHRHPYWYDQVKRDQLSGGDLISNFADQPGEASYRFTAPSAGEYELWVRANPIQAKLSYRLNDDRSWTPSTSTRGLDSTNIATDGKPDLRFLAWARAGKVSLKKGTNGIRFRMDSSNNNHGYLDCFVLTNEPFTPRGAVKPDQFAAAARRVAAANKGWFAFDPKPDKFSAASGIDLRALNEKTAGDGGFIAVKGSQFVHSQDGRADSVLGRQRAVEQGTRRPAHRGTDAGQARRESRPRPPRLLRRQGRRRSRRGPARPRRRRGDEGRGHLQPLLDLLPALAETKARHSLAEGLRRPEDPLRRALLQQGVPAAVPEVVEGPAADAQSLDRHAADRRPGRRGPGNHQRRLVFLLDVQPRAIPDPELRLLEAQFGDWLTQKYGSIDRALRAWGGQKVNRDRPAEGRMGFRPLWNMFNERTARDKDTARFLVESQRGFYHDTYQFLRGLGFKGVITASNWITASPQVLGPLEKYTYTVGDFIDRHGYFGCHSQGEASEWSIRDGHTYADRSALRFDPEEPGKPRVFVHPAMDPSYDGKPSMISETTWNRPNRYRSEAPLFYAVYGALQDSDAIVHFALDTAAWSVKPGFFMQPWTLMSPAMMGQFPAAALIYRKGLVATGDLLVDLNLKIGDLLDLQGTPMPQDAALDELRLKDVPKGTTLKPGNVIDPLVHLAGRTNVNFTDLSGPAKLKDLRPFIDRRRQVVASSTGQLRLDYGKGVLTIDAPAAQGISGALREAGMAELKDLTISSKLELGHIVAVSLDGKPLANRGASYSRQCPRKSPPISVPSLRRAGTRRLLVSATTLGW